MKAAIWSIPGFLGLPTDWNFLQWKHLIGVDLHAFSWNSLSEWAMQLNEWVDSCKKKPSVLMGYSLGGRLALHALLDRPEQWQAAIIVSAHPGLANDHERKKRREHDQKWAERFEREEWTSLMQAWNGQEMFAQDHVHFSRQEQHYQRSQLTQVLIHGSVAQQADLRKQIANSSVPLLWITGSHDRRYCQIAQDLTFAHPYSRWEQVPQAGHRIPWEQPHIFSQIIQNFLQKIE